MQQTLAILLLIARLGDIGSTYLVTPNLRLEGNPIVRRLGWKYAIATLLLCLVPYAHVGAGIALLVASLLVTSSNLSRGWLARAMGEDAYQKFLAGVATRSTMREALAFQLASAAICASVGVLLIVLRGSDDVAFWYAWGIIAYAFAMALYGTLATVRLFKRDRPAADRLA